MEQPATWESDVVLVDGGTVHLRPVRPGDEEAVAAFYERMSAESRYLRFFSGTSPSRAMRFERLEAIDDDRHFVLVAELGGDVVALARYDRQGPDTAEVAFSVQDDQQGRGLGTVMLEHLAVVARTRGIRRFVATALSANHKMLRVFQDVGFGIERSWDHGVAHVAFEITPTAASADVQLRREHLSEARSIARLLAPASVAVVGAGRDPASIGHAILRNLVDGDFVGTIHPVNPNASSVVGLRAHPSVRDVPDGVDLAIVAVPADDVVDVARQCVDKAVRGLVVISAGFGEVPGGRVRERELVSVARGGGMRVVGPNCMGVLNTNPGVRMNATFAPSAPPPGKVAFASQSGGLGIGLLARARELGFGISTFVSMGNKADVSGNDLLQYWEDDPDTDVILLYLESFGNPRKFARLSRRIAQRKPIVAVKSGRTTAGERGTSSHTAALAAPDVAVDALFQQAGVIRVDTLEELFDVARVLVHQPLPPGRRVGIVSNGGGPAILAADACVAAGLEVNELELATQETLRSFVSPDAAVANPVDLVASANPDTFARAVRTLLDDDTVDALVVLFVAPIVIRTDEVAAAITNTVAESGAAKPVLACFLAPDGTSRIEGAPVVVPTFDFPEDAARALSRVAGHAEWRRRPVGDVPELTGVDVSRARRLVRDHLAAHSEGGWLDPLAAFDLLACFGIPAAATRVAATAEEAATHAEAVGFPVALKAASSELVHKTELGGVRVGLASASAVQAAFTEMEAALGERMGGAVVQRMIDPGVETIVGVTHDPSFGPLVLFGMGGVQAELLRDAAVRLAPLTDVDAHAIVRALRASALLFGYRDTSVVDVAALEDLLVRVGVLAERVPEVAELDCNPVIVAPDGATVVDVKVRVASVEPSAPAELRRLRPVR